MLRNIGRFVSSAVSGGILSDESSGPAPQTGAGGSNQGLLDENHLSEVVLPIGGRQIRVVKKLGEGGYAVVYLAQDVQSGELYALKHMYAPDLETQQLQEWECTVMKKVQPPAEEGADQDSASFVIGYYGAVSKPLPGNSKEYYILVEYCRGGDLADVLRNRKGRPLPEKDVCLVFEQVCRGIQELHKLRPPIAHRDIKLENILILEKHTRLHEEGSSGAYTCKLIDYGSATSRAQVYETPAEIALEEDRVQKHCTPSYRAPELVDLYTRQLVNEKVDIWAAGCVLYLLAFQRHAFDDGSPLAIINGRVEIPEKHSFTAYVPALIKRLLVVDPAKRPSIDRVLELIGQWKAFLEQGGNPELADQKLKKLNEAVQQQQRLLQEAQRRNVEPQKNPRQHRHQKSRSSPAGRDAGDWEDADDWNPFGGGGGGGGGMRDGQGKKELPATEESSRKTPLSFVPASNTVQSRPSSAASAASGPESCPMSSASPEAEFGEGFDFSAFEAVDGGQEEPGAPSRTMQARASLVTQSVPQFSAVEESDDDEAFGFAIHRSQVQKRQAVSSSSASSSSSSSSSHPRQRSRTGSASSLTPARPHVSEAFLSDFGFAAEDPKMDEGAAAVDQFETAPGPSVRQKSSSDQEFAAAFAEFSLEESSSPESSRASSSSSASQPDGSRMHIKLPKNLGQSAGRRRRKSKSEGYTIGMPKTPLAGGAAPGESRRRRGSQSQPNQKREAAVAELNFQSFDEHAALFK